MCNARTILQIIYLTFLVVECVDSFAFGATNITRFRRQTNKENCPKPNFLCKSGECIDGDKECDGLVDCKDTSDETNSCQRLKCPSYLFTCKYGACINEELICDGKSDCKDGSDENTDQCKTSETRCQSDEFRCSSGQCINEDFKCDGKAECDDHSDEIRATCWNVRCPGFTYKCAYGGCVNGNAQCNGVVECFDGSDEDPSVCKVPISTEPPVVPVVTPGTSRRGCILPNQPEFGRLEISGSFDTYEPGKVVREHTILKVICAKPHKLDGQERIECENGMWSSPVGNCLRGCPQIMSTSTLSVSCTYRNGIEKPNCMDAVDGTLAKFKCAPFYEDFNLKRRPVHICKDGTWDFPRPHCVPVCGQKTVDPTRLILNGTNVKKGEYPWQVALFNKQDKELICGGSLLSQKVILTAAHCVTDIKGSKLCKANYIVGVGVYYRTFNDSRDITDAQFSDLEDIYVPSLYQGATQNYMGDMALLITKTVFSLSRRVQPVCLDTGLVYSISHNDFGYVTGWGFTKENSASSETLKELKVPAVSISECKQKIPEDYDVFLTNDKMCAGYLDIGTSVCRGDSGGGLVFKHDGRYYITGIVSLSPTSPVAVGGCDSHQYGLYTNVANYIKDILENLAQYKV